MLERDSMGYLVYKPCDGSTPEINLESAGILTIQWQLEETKSRIKRFTQINTNNFLIKCSGTVENGKLMSVKPNISFQIRLVDKTRDLYLWTYIADYGRRINIKDTTKWVMTPTKYIGNFRKVDNPCSTEKISEKIFLPVEFR
ncbi:MAG: hypothetical protein JWN76_3265 [Chitinophagaceae bacterium]|nr:hypothetical protein [Chitinophagaceae bacterium]